MNFTGTAVGGLPPYKYSWNFGGTTTSSSRTPSHTYLYTGNYSAVVTVTDLVGASDTASVSIHVGATGAPSLTATATASPASGSAPLTVTFSGNATGGHRPYTYNWSFGDGSTSALQSPSHVYASSGAYTATLTIRDGNGHNATASATVSAGGTVSGVASTLVGTSVLGVAPPSFYGVDLQTKCRSCVWTNASVKGFLNATPFTWYRYGTDSDRCNSSANLQYADDGSTGGCAYDVTALKSWCATVTPHCHAILDLPAENNNSAQVAAIAKWIVSTVGFQPDYWSIGNEPTGWTHYGIPWTQWKTTDARSPTPLAYAFDVKAAIAAVKAVDPAAKFIGIEAACSCNTVWFQDVVRINGPNLAAIAYHSYPSTGATTETLDAFLSPLATTSNLTSSYATVRSDIVGYCTACATMPIFVHEYNAGPGWAPSNHAGSYADALFLAASVTQALRANVTQLTVYNLQTSSTTGYGFSMMNGNGTVGPTGTLYQSVLSALPVGTVIGASVRTTVGNVWSVVTRNATTEALLVVNANLSHAIALGLGSAFATGVSGTVIQWSPSLTVPKVTSGLLATTYSVPSEGILLLQVPLVGGVPATAVAGSAGGSVASPSVAAGGVAIGTVGVAVLVPARPERPVRPTVPDLDDR